MLGALLVLLMPSLGAEQIVHPAGAQGVTAPSWEIQKGSPTALGEKILWCHSFLCPTHGQVWHLSLQWCHPVGASPSPTCCCWAGIISNLNGVRRESFGACTGLWTAPGKPAAGGISLSVVCSPWQGRAVVSRQAAWTPWLGTGQISSLPYTYHNKTKQKKCFLLTQQLL